MTITLNGTTGITTTGLTADTNTLYVDTTNDRVGVGTTSPNNAKLHVVANSADGAGPLKLEAYNVYNTGFAVNNGATNVAQFGTKAMLISGSTDEFGVFANGTAQTLLLGTNNTERMRIDSSGNVKASTTGSYLGDSCHQFGVNNSNSYGLIVFNSSASPASEYLLESRYTGATPNNTSARFINCSDTTNSKMYVWTNGGIANYSANNSNLSDAREKTNVNLAGSYLDKICAIPVKTFNYIDQNLEEDDGLTLGVIAQEVQAVAPELVMESDWGTQDNPKMRLSIYQTDLQYALMKCIQEQQAIITDLKARIETLENK